MKHLRAGHLALRRKEACRMASALQQLPEGYCEIWRADLQKNKKQALAVNGLALGLGAAMLAPFLYGIFQPFFRAASIFTLPSFWPCWRAFWPISPCTSWCMGCA